MLDRKKSLMAMLISSAGFISMALAAPLSSSSPVGYWKTIDDITGKPKSIIQIWKASDEALMGKVIRLYPKAGVNIDNKICQACKGSLHNQPVVGMVILSGLKPAKKQWGEGKILDPANGKTYDCSARLTADGEKLLVRGYIGMPLFGRSQTWERVDLMSG